MKHQEEQERDELRARFTKWMEVLLYRARVDYLRKEAKNQRICYMEEIPEEYLVEEQSEKEWFRKLIEKDGFDFTEEKLADAFHSMLASRQDILRMLFVEERTPKEIAAKKNCSLQYVYKQREQALNNLRKTLRKGGADDEQ